ncbi:glycoside hydrolase family 20 protein [Streptomyces sp. NPDC008001]|uniref:beta-N-acetylhexosaminidase n=1 Tax=Streptomyces sp. NPDC008001 TaxID=3364804 RepID=UPI0036E23744
MGLRLRTTRASAVRGTVCAAVLLVTMTLMGCPREGGAARPPSHDDSRSPRASSASPSASRSPVRQSSAQAPVPAGIPRAIPAVRSAEAAPGPGWRPVDGARVIASGPLADEGRRLAAELRLQYVAAGPARSGDVELALRPGTGQGPLAAEGYELTARGGKVLVASAGEAGVFYGTRTLLQAVRSGGGLPEGVVRDGPDRAQRGLHLDIARKHFTAAWIEDRVRELSALKLNQLALHFSDDQGFRIESDSHPEIVSKQHLTKAEVRRIVALAESLHVTVIPELDSPGHLGAVIAAHPTLQLRDAAGKAARGAVDIANPDAGRIVDDLLREYAPLFPGPWFHLGADEYRALMAKNPEASYPRLAARAKEKYGPRARVQDLATGWLNDRAAFVRTLGKKAKAWNDGFFPGGVVTANKDIEAEYWTGKEIGARAPQDYLNEGRPLVNLNDEYLYYVLGEPNQFRYPTGQRIYEQWSPAVLRGTAPVPAQSGPDRVPGGRLAVWCDHPDAQTPQQVATGIHLPLAATSQRLWDARRPTIPWRDFATLDAKVR